MALKSMFNDPPALPDMNVHNFCFRRSDQLNASPDSPWSKDYTVHIDAHTGKKRTYRQFLDRVYDGATALATPEQQGGLGLSADAGEIIGILGVNSMDYMVLVHALLTITTPFALFSSYSTSYELAHVMRLSRATRLFVDPSALPLALKVAKEVGLPENRVYTLNGSVRGRKSFGEMVRQVRIKKVHRVEIRPAQKDTLAYLVFSSGTSGLPKSVMISHGNLIYAMQQYIVMVQEALTVMTPPVLNTPEGIPVVLGFLPLYHTYGFHMFCFRAFIAPLTVVLLPKWKVEDALKAISRHRITTLPLIPSVVHQLVNHPKIKQADLSSVVSAGSGAAYLPPELSDKLKGLTGNKIEMAEGYGMSETTISAISQPYPNSLGGRGQRISGSAGVLLPGMKARIVRDDGSETDADVNEAGELWLQGENIALGYWNNEKATKETFVDGWLRTGDRFRHDGKGNFYFADRVKDTLKVSGIQVSPVEIEQVILAHTGGYVSDVTVAGVSGFGRTVDEKVPRAWIVLSKKGKDAGKDVVVKALEAWTQENLSRYKWLRGGFEVVNEIPKNATGKVLRRVLQEKYELKLEKKNKVKAKL